MREEPIGVYGGCWETRTNTYVNVVYGDWARIRFRGNRSGFRTFLLSRRRR